MATILVIDDERLLCDLLQEMLQRQGHEVFTAYSGQEGIQAFRVTGRSSRSWTSICRT